jgi:2-keto-4-pentenoate hydratase
MHTMPDLDFEDPLARALWLARRDATTIAPPDPGELTLERADRVASQLYQAVEAGGGRQVAWKLGAGDAAAQARFGTDGPFTAPVYGASCLRDGATLRLAGLVAPRLEAEIGLRFDGDGSPAVLPCIEIIDCRFPGWQIKIAGVLADFGLQGAMVFGEPGSAGPQVRAVVRRDGEVIAEGAGAVERAVAMVRDALGDQRLAAVPLVASGSLVAPPPLEPGRHEVDFGPLGMLRLEVTA